jgi:hypothetical protein
MKNSLYDNVLHLFIGIGLIIFYIDSLIPPGYTEWLLYAIMLIIFTKLGNRTSVIILFSIYTILIIAGYFSFPAVNINKSIPIVNRIIAICSLVLIAYSGLRLRKTTKT